MTGHRAQPAASDWPATACGRHPRSKRSDGLSFEAIRPIIRHVVEDGRDWFGKMDQRRASPGYSCSERQGDRRAGGEKQVKARPNYPCLPAGTPSRHVGSSCADRKASTVTRPTPRRYFHAVAATRRRCVLRPRRATIWSTRSGFILESITSCAAPSRPPRSSTRAGAISS